MLSAWLGGLGPGLLAEALSVLVVEFLYLPPLISPSVSGRGDLLQIALFLIEASLIVLLASQLRGARERAAASAAEALDAVRTRNEFLAAAAHDLRAPLTAVSGYAQILRRNLGRTGVMDAEQATGLLGQIEESASHMAAMLEELLDLARLQAGEQLSLTRTPTDLAALTMARVKAFQTAAGAAIRPEIEQEPVVGLWDAGRLARVLDNLLSNAIKYSPDGGEITVRLTCVRDESAGAGRAVLEVQDQGVGIPAADLPHIFERYHRASNVRNRIGGMGIGLAGVRQIVEQHGGSVAIHSRLGTGTTVCVSLPME